MSTPRPLAIVTGGMTRMGAVIAARLADAGYDLALHKRAPVAPDPDLADALARNGTAWKNFCADLADADAVTALMAEVIDHFGHTPVLLVNNASLFAESRWASLTAVEIDAAMRVNLTAPVILATQLARALSTGARASIVNIVDQRVANPVPDQIAYTLSKQALWQATRTLAVALAPHVRVNAVAPGLTLPTDDYGVAQWDRLAARMPLSVLPTPGQIADAVLYLAGADATTGQTIFVDGGAHMAPMDRDFVYLNREG
jgi:NAD(P)-dependent dehydrogenase (short-subunit alcohol dehydrogenase family)